MYSFQESSSSSSVCLLPRSINDVKGQVYLILGESNYLAVSGYKPYINMDVELIPLTYVRRPEFWEIEVVCAVRSGILLPAVAPFSTGLLSLTEITGSKGIEIVWADEKMQIDLHESDTSFYRAHGITVIWMDLGYEQRIELEASEQQATLTALPLETMQQVMEICCGSPVPSGWIKVNDHWDPTRCGRPTSIMYNICTIERYDNKRVGLLMEVCAGSPTPNGWVTENTFWDPSRCGHPSSIIHNMKRIRRVS